MQLLKSWDRSGSKRVECHGFKRAVHALRLERDYTDAELDRLFAYLDHDGTGYVTFLDLKLRLRPEAAAREGHLMHLHSSGRVRIPPAAW